MENKNERRREEILRISGVDTKKCIRCGKCTASCPNYDEMEYHPHQFVYMVNNGELEPLFKSESIYKCLTCFTCAQRCLRGVEPARLIEAVRTVAIREKGANHLTPGMIPTMLDEDIPGQAIMSALRKYSK